MRLMVIDMDYLMLMLYSIFTALLSALTTLFLAGFLDTEEDKKDE